MRIIADVPEYIVKKVREKIEGGDYSNFESFVVTALENQLVLENGNTLDQSKEELGSGGAPAKGESLNLLKRADNKSISFIDQPTFKDLQLWGKPKDESQLWMWGQINRLLPIKVSLRVLTNSAGGSSGWMDLETVSKTAADVAHQFGLHLLERDGREGRLHGEKLSAAFPLGENSEKSAKRFSSQFIGYITKEGRFGGSLPFLRMASLKKEKDKEWIGITKAGAEFANIENPILDGDLKSSHSFGPMEVDFYLDHITKNVPGEKQAFASILKIIADGITDRESINQALKKMVDSSWSDQVLGTQRAGAMARMNELGLIDRKKEGVEVIFSISVRGKKFLESL